MLGSCRVRIPFKMLADQGKVAIAFDMRPFIHSGSEALQVVRYYRQELNVPRHVSPYIFEQDIEPDTSTYTQALIDSADTVIVEVCDSRLIEYRGLFFQSNFFMRQFVQKMGRPGLDWSRTLSLKGKAGEDDVQATLGKLAAAGTPASAETADILRHTAMTKETAGELVESLRQILAGGSKQAIFVSHFTVPGETGMIMQDRAAMQAKLADAARELGATFFNPTSLIEQHGRRAALDADGADIYEYNPAFNSVVGDALAGLVDALWQGKPDSEPMLRRKPGAAVSANAKQLNERLVDFAGERLARLGLRDSGLFEHYKALLETGDILSPRLPTAQAIAGVLPHFTRYVILRAGLGEVGFMLKPLDAQIDFFEPNGGRFAAIKAFQEREIEQGFGAPLREGLHLATLPDEAYVAGIGDLDQTLLVVPDFLTGALGIGEVMAAVSRFPKIVFEPHNFMRQRKTAAEIDEVFEMFAKAGYAPARKVHSAGLWYVERPQVAVAEAGSNRFLDRLRENFDAGPSRLFCRLSGGDGEVDLPWSGLQSNCQQFQTAYRAAGLPRDGVVLIFLRHTRDLYGAFFGAMASGLVPSFMPPSSPRQDLNIYWGSHKALLAHIQPAAIVIDAATLAEMNAAGLDLGGAVVLDAADVKRAFDPIAGGQLEIEARPGTAIALLQHSSGTTGLKKGVALSFDAIADQLDSYAATLAAGRDDVIVSWLPLYHDMGLIACCMLPAYFAIPVVHLDAFHWLARPGLLLEQIVASKGTLCWLPNFAFEHLAAVAGRHADQYDLSRMRAFVNCSEVCKPKTFDKFLAAFAVSGLRADQLHCCYAMAETVFAVSQSRLGAPALRLRADPASLLRGERVRAAAPQEAGTELIETGAPIEGIAVKVVDENRLELPEGCVGELALSGDFLFSGYYKDSGRTAAQVAAGVYYSRDLGFVHAGRLFVLGRIDDLIIVNGRNLYAHEIESVVAGVEGVKPGRGVAVPMYEERLGSEVLVVIAERQRDTTRADADMQRDISSGILSTFNVMPRRVSIVEEGWLVKTTSGKISRKENLAKLMNPAA